MRNFSITKNFIHYIKRRIINSKIQYSTEANTILKKSTNKSKTKNSPIIFNNRNPSLQDFILASQKQTSINKNNLNSEPINVPYLKEDTYNNKVLNYYVEVYGCQMNVSDAEILTAVMDKAGYIKTNNIEEADVVFLVTCAIRDAAEQKIWHRLIQLKKLKRLHHPQKLPPTVGVLGCMAERLKEKLLEQSKLVDIVCGPDAYRSLPNLINIHASTTQGVANVILSADETYADIIPVRKDDSNFSAFVSIMRGCNNMCSYCIVPFTRGIERSRPMDSILDEVRMLSDQGVKEVVLLGQNVNSYRDTSTSKYFIPQGIGSELSNSGFKTIYKRKEGGIRFAELVDKVANINPEMRIRFTSPHPKDFPDALLDVIQNYDNVCKSIHLPAQSGSTKVLEAMRRGYSREAYLELVNHIKKKIPSISFSSDFISGFCGETELDHLDTLSLIEYVQFDMAYMFAYSLREGTHAHRKLNDDVPIEIKKRRLNEVIQIFHKSAQKKFEELKLKKQLVLIDSIPHLKHLKVGKLFAGRTDGNHRAFIKLTKENENEFKHLKIGDYVEILPIEVTSTSITGIPIKKSSIREFSRS